MPPASAKLRRFVIGFWIVNLIVAMAVVAAWFWMNRTAKVSFVSPIPTMTRVSTLAAKRTFLPTPTLPSTDTLTPSDTPTATETPTETLTPIPFSEGPFTIGKSVKGLPLEVYRFGTGPTERLIVAGMHGGNEYNTVELADQLISYIGKHPDVIPSNVALYILVT